MKFHNKVFFFHLRHSSLKYHLFFSLYITYDKLNTVYNTVYSSSKGQYESMLVSIIKKNIKKNMLKTRLSWHEQLKDMTTQLKSFTYRM